MRRDSDVATLSERIGYSNEMVTGNQAPYLFY